MKRLLTIALLAALWLNAQEKKESPSILEKRTARLIPVKHLKDVQLAQALNLLRTFGVQIQDSNLGMITVAGPESMVAAVEEALKKLDVPAPPAPSPKNVEVILYVVAASSKFQDDSLAPGLEPVIKQMRGIFQYPHYKTLDTQIMRFRLSAPGSNHVAESQGQLQHPVQERSYNCNTKLSMSATEDQKGRLFRTNNFEFYCRTSANPAANQAYIRTDLDLREGQKAVVGKSSLGDDSAIFLVLSAKQLD